jgi:hypothetical protein
MSGRQLTNAASDTARSIRRRLAVAAPERSHGEPAASGAAPAEEREIRDGARDPDADDARLDALRGDLVRELDRLAAADLGSSASFRRI